MSPFVWAQRNVGEGSLSQDCVAVVPWDDGVIIALADGAGGIAGGAEAAERVIRAIQDPARRPSEPTDPAGWCRFLGDLDDEIQECPDGGETTAVVLYANAASISGASVGDSEAWLVLDDGLEDLTLYQQRKPILGTGVAVPAPFHARPWSGTLLVATDGLLHYGKLQSILEQARGADIEASAAALIDLVRLRSGKLQDDTSVVLVRRSGT